MMNEDVESPKDVQSLLGAHWRNSLNVHNCKASSQSHCKSKNRKICTKCHAVSHIIRASGRTGEVLFSDTSLPPWTQPHQLRPSHAPMHARKPTVVSNLGNYTFSLFTTRNLSSPLRESVHYLQSLLDSVVTFISCMSPCDERSLSRAQTTHRGETAEGTDMYSLICQR